MLKEGQEKKAPKSHLMANIKNYHIRPKELELLLPRRCCRRKCIQNGDVIFTFLWIIFARPCEWNKCAAGVYDKHFRIWSDALLPFFFLSSTFGFSSFVHIPILVDAYVCGLEFYFLATHDFHTFFFLQKFTRLEAACLRFSPRSLEDALAKISFWNFEAAVCRRG